MLDRGAARLLGPRVLPQLAYSDDGSLQALWVPSHFEASCDIQRFLSGEPCILVDGHVRCWVSQTAVCVLKCMCYSVVGRWLAQDATPKCEDHDDLQEQGRTQVLERIEVSQEHGEPRHKKETNKNMSDCRIFGYNVLRIYPEPFADAVVRLADDLKRTRTDFGLQVPIRLPEGPEIVLATHNDDESFAQADLASCFEYLRGGKNLLLPGHWREIIPELMPKRRNPWIVDCS